MTKWGDKGEWGWKGYVKGDEVDLEDTRVALGHGGGAEFLEHF